MAVIAAYTSPAIGHAYPFAGVLLELRRRGHRIHMRTLASEVDRMRMLGFDAGPIDPRIERIELDDWHAQRVVDGLARTGATFCRRGELDGPDMRSLIDDSQPDLLLTDVNSWGATAVAERSGLPWVALSPYTPCLRSPSAPPFGPGLLPARGRIGAIRDAVVDRTVFRAATRAVVPALNALRARVAGLPPVATIDEMLRRAPLTIVTTAEPFEYHHDDWAPRMRLVGPVSWEPTMATPAWLDAIEGPMVLVSTASEYQGDTAMVRVALEALRDEPVTVVATMPAAARLGMEPPPNARVVDFVPHGLVLGRAVCAITHGGMGVTQKALARRVPVVAVPWGRDQFEVAARVEHARAGVRLQRKHLTPERLLDAVRTARGMREGVEAVAAGFKAAGGAAHAATLLEERLWEGTPA